MCTVKLKQSDCLCDLSCYNKQDGKFSSELTSYLSICALISDLFLFSVSFPCRYFFLQFTTNMYFFVTTNLPPQLTFHTLELTFDHSYNLRACKNVSVLYPPIQKEMWIQRNISSFSFMKKLSIWWKKSVFHDKILLE